MQLLTRRSGGGAPPGCFKSTVTLPLRGQQTRGFAAHSWALEIRKIGVPRPHRATMRTLLLPFLLLSEVG